MMPRAEHLHPLVTPLHGPGAWTRRLKRCGSRGRRLWCLVVNTRVWQDIAEEVLDAIRLSQPPEGKGAAFVLLPNAEGDPDPRTNLDDEIVMRGCAFKR